MYRGIVISIGCMLFFLHGFSQSQSIQVLSWNIFMIPPIIYKSCQCERAPLIADLVKKLNPDVIVFQEAFQKKPRNIIWENIKNIYPYESGVTRGGFLKVHSGVWIVSKYPIERKESIVYKRAKGSDKLSKKGATLIEINVDGKRVQIIGTHVQSDSKYQDIRNLQFKQLIDELASKYFDSTIPQLIVGDLNTDFFVTKDYLDMIGILDVGGVKHTGETFSWNGASNDLGKRFFGVHQEILDYILLRNPHQKIAYIDQEIIYSPIGSESFCNKGFKALSDHYPVMAEVTIN